MITKRTIGLVLICLLTIGIASVYATGGNPFDRLDATFEEVKSDLANLWNVVTGEGGFEARVLALELENAELAARVSALESLPPGLGVPDFDSGWKSIDEVLTFFHGLSSIEDVFVYVVGRSTYSLPTKFQHQTYYGGIYDESAPYEPFWGVRWELYDDMIKVFQNVDPALKNHWEEVRVMIWQLPSPP